MITLVILQKQFKRKINLDLNPKIKTIFFSYLLPYIRGLLIRTSKKYNANNKWIFDIRNNQSINEILKSSDLSNLIKRGVATRIM